jgi:nucleoside-triphosphatase THEP1
MTAEALSLSAQLARDTVGRWIRGTTVPTLATLRRAEGVLSAQLGYPVDLSAAARERRSSRRPIRQAPGMIPGSAHRGDVMAYLRTLIRWLNADPWPRDPRLAGPVLTPGAIERRLRVVSRSQDGRQRILGADELADQASRLVVLGGPGSGKTWLAMRLARQCAEKALTALAAGQPLDEVELPLFTTCSRVFSAPGDIRQAIISAALNHVADLGDPQATDALRRMFAARDKATLLVVDSLDEAPGSDERLRQADWLPWRIAITSRPSAWHGQLSIEHEHDSHRVGTLMPLSYPGDVQAFIRSWFKDQPERGEDLIGQIARSPGLQQSATVPLILAFYCILGGQARLPEFRRDVHALVLRRIVTGRWRGSGEPPPDPGKCMKTLRKWAWSNAECDSRSGIGTWADDIHTKPSPHRALDHVAVPIGLPDLDTRKVTRRFIHRSLREQLVAEYVAALPVQQAARNLLPHLWYDADWEYAAPAAIAMHPQHDHLLRELATLTSGTHQVADSLEALDRDQEWQRLLARIASESHEDDWSPQAAKIISRALIRLIDAADIAITDEVWRGGIPPRQFRTQLLTLMKRQPDPAVVSRLMRWVIQLAPTTTSRREAGKALLLLLAGARTPVVAKELVNGLEQLSSAPDDRRRNRNALITLISARNADWDLCEQLCAEQWFSSRAWHMFIFKAPTAGISQDRADKERDGEVAAPIVDAVARLALSADEKRQAREALTGMLAYQIAGQHVHRSMLDDDRTNPFMIPPLAAGVARLAPGGEDKRQARDALSGLLHRAADGNSAAALAQALTQLDPTPQEEHQIRQALLTQLRRTARSAIADMLLDVLSRLTPTEDDKRQIQDALHERLRNPRSRVNDWRDLARIRTRLQSADPIAELDLGEDYRRQAEEILVARLADAADAEQAARLASLVSTLGPTEHCRRQAEEILLARLADAADAADAEQAARLASLVSTLGLTEHCRRQARHTLLVLLDQCALRPEISTLPLRVVDQIVALNPTDHDKRRARETILALLARHAGPEPADDALCHWTACLAKALSQLGTVTATQDASQTIESLLSLLTTQPGRNPSPGRDLTEAIIELAATPAQRRNARETLTGLLTKLHSETTRYLPETAAYLADGLARLSATAEDQRESRETLLAVMARQTDSGTATNIASALLKLSPGTQEKHLARNKLLMLANNEPGADRSRRLIDTIAQLELTADDVGILQKWAAGHTAELLATVRRNTTVTDWIALRATLFAEHQ